MAAIEDGVVAANAKPATSEEHRASRGAPRPDTRPSCRSARRRVSPMSRKNGAMKGPVAPTSGPSAPEPAPTSAKRGPTARRAGSKPRSSQSFRQVATSTKTPIARRSASGGACWTRGSVRAPAGSTSSAKGPSRSRRRCRRWTTTRLEFEVSWISAWTGIATAGSRKSSMIASSRMPPAIPRTAETTAPIRLARTSRAELERVHERGLPGGRSRRVGRLGAAERWNEKTGRRRGP